MLTRSKDRKVTNAVSPNGKTPTIANSIGLPAGTDYSCPDATSYCEKICYANKLEKIYKGVANILTDNFNQLKNADFDQKVYLLNSMLSDFRAECEKRNADKLFRIHWDGDFFDSEYTNAWIHVISRNEDIQFWVYTRNPRAAVDLHKAVLFNLSLYFSADPVNINTAKALNKTYGIRIAFVDETFDEAKDKLGDIKAVRCPENNKAIELISQKGSACVRCGLCIFNRNNVLFSRKKK
jgi:hypothetical protein